MERTKTTHFLVMCLILVLAGCDGWQVDGAAKVGSDNQPYVEIPYEISLSQDGMMGEEFTGSVRAYFQMDADMFSLSGDKTFVDDVVPCCSCHLHLDLVERYS